MTSDILSAVAKFPFIMVMTAHFLRGSLFLLVNVPLLSTIFIETSQRTALPKTFIELFNQIIISYWKASTASFGNILIIPLFIFLGLICGLLITPIERLFAWAISKIAEKIIKIFTEKILFLGTEATSVEYTEQLSWFLSNPDKKLHWEWELFLYFVYWGASLNILIFCLSAVIILWFEISWLQIIIYFVTVMIFVLFAIGRSLVMGQVHEFYSKEYKKQA